MPGRRSDLHSPGTAQEGLPLLLRLGRPCRAAGAGSPYDLAIDIMPEYRTCRCPAPQRGGAGSTMGRTAPNRGEMGRRPPSARGPGRWRGGAAGGRGGRPVWMGARTGQAESSGPDLLPPQQPTQRLEALRVGTFEQRGHLRLGAGEDHRRVIAAAIDESLQVRRPWHVVDGVEPSREGCAST